MSLTKAQLVEVLADFTKDTLKDFIDGKDIKKSGSKAELLERIKDSHSVTKDELVNFIFNNFDLNRVKFKVFHSDSGLQSLDLNNVDLDSLTNVTSTRINHKGEIEAFKKIGISGIWDFDPEEHDLDEYDDDDFDDFNFQIPIKIRKMDNYLIVSAYTLFFGRYHTASSGERVYLHEILFDFQDFACEARDQVKTDSGITDIDITNLSTGVKKLVTDKKIDSVMAACDDEGNHGKNMRKLHKGSSKSFVDRSWYAAHDFFKTDKIYTTNWYWTNGDSVLKKPEEYTSLNVDCGSGTIIKGKKTEDELNWFIDEIIKNN